MSLVMIISVLLSASYGVFGTIRVLVDDALIKFPDAQPFIDESNRTQVPVKFVSEALGAVVTWDEKTRVVTMKKGKDIITLKIGEKVIKVNGKEKALDTKALIKEERTFVPLKFVSEALGASVKWEASTLTASINTKVAPKSDVVVVKGYTIPNGTSMIFMGADYKDKNIEQFFSIQMLDNDIPEQKLAVRSAIESKFGKKIADEVYNHINKKKERFDSLPGKDIKIESTNQLIIIRPSGGSSIDIHILHPGIKRGNMITTYYEE